MSPQSKPVRKRPARGVLQVSGQSTVVFLTVCTRDRNRWLIRPGVHEMVRKAWERAAAWRVGNYLLMPDHVHLFCTPHQSDVKLNEWVRFWKSMTTRLHGRSDWRWQSLHWDTRLRSGKQFTEKWRYVQNNPVRAGLVESPENWPHQGKVHTIRW